MIFAGRALVKKRQSNAPLCTASTNAVISCCRISDRSGWTL